MIYRVEDTDSYMPLHVLAKGRTPWDEQVRDALIVALDRFIDWEENLITMHCLSDPALPREIAKHCGSFYPGLGGYCRVCGCTLYYPDDIENAECAGCYGWGARIARYLTAKHSHGSE